MDWELFQEDYRDDTDGFFNCITDYVRFCEDSIVPSNKVCCFLNNKFWINKEIKGLLNRKKRAIMAR